MWDFASRTPGALGLRELARPWMQAVQARVRQHTQLGVRSGTDVLFIDRLSDQGALRDYVVVGLGTNGPVDSDALQDIYDRVGRDRTLVLVTAFAPRDWIPGVNAELTAFAASHPGSTDR